MLKPLKYPQNRLNRMLIVGVPSKRIEFPAFDLGNDVSLSFLFISICLYCACTCQRCYKFECNSIVCQGEHLILDGTRNT
jgi:hypothetical protein